MNCQAFLSGSIVNIQLVNEIQSLEGDIRKQIYDKGLAAKLTFDDMVGTAPAMASVIRTARKYSQTNSNILLIGESGTGKAGLFELAHTGTIFLDEIGEIPLPLQAKLLRVLQEREIMRVGGDSVIHVDIRIIAATNKNLESLVRSNQFREDLFYRLDVLRINIPPLNQHREDIPLLISRYMNRNFPGITTGPEVIQFLCRADWTGNIRHLFNICERMAVLCSNGHIDLPYYLFLYHQASSYPSLWINNPLRSFGSNQVDLGGMSRPASATSSSSRMEVGYMEKATFMSS